MYSPPHAATTEGTDAALAMPPCDGTAAWYVAYAQAKQENVAAINLQRQGFHTYLPLYKTFRKLPPKQTPSSAQATGLITYEPMFPRYMFFQPSSGKQSISVVRSTRGIKSIVRFGSRFATVQPEVLKAIWELEQLRNQADTCDISPFQPGRRVRLRDPGLSRLEGLVHSVSSRRVTVLMEILGRQQQIKVEHDRLELV